MLRDGMIGSGPGSKNSFDTDRRDADRIALMIRSAKLICNGGEYLCVVRDVSHGGVRLRLFHALPHEDQLTLELATGDRHSLERVWERDGEVGLRFADEIDVRDFINEGGVFRKRPVRLRFDCPVTVLVGERPYQAVMRDMSRQGARIDLDMSLPIGQRIQIDAPGFPEKFATVCWRRWPAHGVVFHQSFTFDCLAKLANRLQAPAPAPLLPAGAPALTAGCVPPTIRRFDSPPHCRTCNSDCPANADR